MAHGPSLESFRSHEMVFFKVDLKGMQQLITLSPIFAARSQDNSSLAVVMHVKPTRKSEEYTSTGVAYASDY
jgi:hypothetical protein